MNTLRFFIMIVLTIILIIGQNFIENINFYYNISVEIYIYFLLPILGIVYGFLLGILNRKSKINQSKIEKKYNVLLLIFFLVVYYLPIIPNVGLCFSYFLLMSGVRKYVCPILCGFYLNRILL